MKYIIIILIVLLVGCATRIPPMPAPSPMKTPQDILTSTRGHDEEVKKDPN